MQNFDFQQNRRLFFDKFVVNNAQNKRPMSVENIGETLKIMKIFESNRDFTSVISDFACEGVKRCTNFSKKVNVERSSMRGCQTIEQKNPMK